MQEASVSKQQIKPPAPLPCKNPLTPYLFLYVLMMRVSQIWGVASKQSCYYLAKLGLIASYLHLTSCAWIIVVIIVSFIAAEEKKAWPAWHWTWANEQIRDKRETPSEPDSPHWPLPRTSLSRGVLVRCWELGPSLTRKEDLLRWKWLSGHSHIPHCHAGRVSGYQEMAIREGGEKLG